MKNSPHLYLARKFWKEHVCKGHVVVDATLGNGHDSLYLSLLALDDTEGFLYGFDIQTEAIESTKALLRKNLPFKTLQRIRLYQKSHIDFFELSSPIDLFVYNLGYLPGGDKSITTIAEITITSLQKACSLLAPKGALSIMAYVGHEAGKIENTKVKEFLSCLDESFTVLEHCWLNKLLAPIFYWVTKK